MSERGVRLIALWEADKKAAQELDAIRAGLAQALDEARREAAAIVAEGARANMRYGPGPNPNAKHPSDWLPHIRDTIFAGGRGVHTTHPAGRLWEIGGVIAPRGYAIRIPRLAMAERAAEGNDARVERILERRVGDLP